jgi:RNA polymerase sigma-70 factor (ECF subfamily)
MTQDASSEDFAAIARTHGAMIARIARSYEANAARAEELVQDIFLAVWQALPGFRGDAQLRSFIARIAHNRAISHVAREVRSPRATVLDDIHPSSAPTPEEAAALTDARMKLEAAVQRLPVNQKLVVTLALEGFSPEEVSEVLGITPSAASVRLHRAKTALQEMLNRSPS